MLAYLSQDFARYSTSFGQKLKHALLMTGMWAVIGYRYRRWLYTSPPPWPLRLPLKAISILLKLGAEISSNIEIPYTADIGPGLSIPHTGYIVIGDTVVIGRNCTLTQGVTVGHARGGSHTKTGSNHR